MWGEVYILVEVIGDQDCEIERGGQFWGGKPKTDTRGLALGVERANNKGGCGGGLCGGADMVVEVLGGQEEKIERRWRFRSAKPKTDARGLGFSVERANNEGGCGGGLWGRIW